jgi:tetratricopeptide (TPR) repeat protein
MKKKLYSSLLLLIFAIGFSQNSISDFERFYKVGNNFYNTPNPTENTDNESISYFQKAINSTKITKPIAAKAVDAATKIGILHQTYIRHSDAIKYYTMALNWHQEFKTHDTTAYLSSLYLGMMYYYENDYSKCYLHLSRAESLYQKYNLSQSSESLFNTLGVLYFDSGNYRQSVNYFQKAQNIEFKLTGKKTNFALQSNIATALRHLGKNYEAIEIYQEAIKLNPNENRIRINLASTFLELKQPENVFAELKKIKPDNDLKNKISVQNLLGRAYIIQNKLDLATTEFNQAISIFNQAELINKNGKNVEIGNTYKFLGDISKLQNE